MEMFIKPHFPVKRVDKIKYFGYGDESIGELINRSAQLVLRELGSPEVETSEGKLISYRSTSDTVAIVVEEDAFPETPQAINPRVTIRIRGIAPESISCDRDFAIVSCAAEQTVLAPIPGRQRLRRDHDQMALPEPGHLGARCPGPRHRSRRPPTHSWRRREVVPTAVSAGEVSAVC